MDIIPFHKASIGQEEIDEVVDTLKSGWLTMGPKTVKFEKEFSNFVGSACAVSTNSATAALHLALKAVGLQPGDEVIVPTMTFVAAAEVVQYFGAIPVLCDVVEDTHNISVADAEKKITAKTRVIIPVHFAGIPCEMDAVNELAKKHKLIVIEDSAHAFPAEYKGQMIGTLSDITCFSFYATKCLSTGEGGMATTNNEAYAESIRVNRLHGINKDVWDRSSARGNWYYEVIDNGFKYNTTDINAALGLVQLKRARELWQKRCNIATIYDQHFNQNSRIKTLKIPKHVKSAYHLYVIKVENRDETLAFLQKNGVGVSVHFMPIHLQPYYQKKYAYKADDFPVANRLYKHSLSLPIYPDINEEQINTVVKKVSETQETSYVQKVRQTSV